MSQGPKDDARHFVIPKCINIPNLESLPQKILEICSGHDHSKNKVRCQGQGHSDLNMFRDTLMSQYASTHQIWNSYLKEYRRYALDRKRDGRTDRQTDGGMDKAFTICLPQFLSGHKTVLLKKLSS